MQDIEKSREIRREKIRQRKRRKLVVISLALLLVVLLITLIVVISNAVRKSNVVETVAIGPTPPTETTAIAPMLTDYDYSNPVPQAHPVSETYFENTLFVGDTRLQGFHLYSVMDNADILSGGAVNVSNAMTYEFELHDGVTTLSDRLQQKNYASIYLMFGMNELGWEYADVFRQTYAALIDEIQTAQPNASIYIHFIVPVSSAKDGNPSYLTNSKIAAYNSLLREIAMEKGVYFLDSSAALCDENGFLQSSFTSDGIHFTKSGVEEWYAYLMTHTVAKENYKN